MKIKLEEHKLSFRCQVKLIRKSSDADIAYSAHIYLSSPNNLLD